jgi:secreted trypsin-like serine protease
MRVCFENLPLVHSFIAINSQLPAIATFIHSSAGSSLTITENMICGGKEGSIISGCHGDSGGPYVCKDTSGRWFLQGSVSWGSPRCSTAERYTVFARMAKFRTWIDDEIDKTTSVAAAYRI